MKGLPCSIYSAKDMPNCSNHGLSFWYDKVILIGPGVPEIFEPDDKDYPAVELVTDWKIPCAVPYGWKNRWHGKLMFGGDFIYTSDDRLPGGVPIKMFDRSESGAVITPPVYCHPLEAGLDSGTMAVRRRLGRLLTALDVEINSHIIQGRMIRDLYRMRTELIDKLKAEGWTMSYDGGDKLKVRQPGHKTPFGVKS